MRVARQLLGAHVGQRAYELSELGVHRPMRVVVDDAREPEVQHLRTPVAIDNDVARLEIAMNDAALMGVMNRVAHLGDELESSSDGQVSRRRMLQQRLALDELHREVGLRAEPAVVGAGEVDLSDVPMPPSPST
jgi:hypothetical protein